MSTRSCSQENADDTVMLLSDLHLNFSFHIMNIIDQELHSKYMIYFCVNVSLPDHLTLMQSYWITRQL